MPTIAIIYGVRIEMKLQQKEHNPPHIHAFYGDCHTSFSIINCEILRGEFPYKQARIVINFIKEHRNELLEMWNAQNFHKIGD